MFISQPKFVLLNTSREEDWAVSPLGQSSTLTSSGTSSGSARTGPSGQALSKALPRTQFCSTRWSSRLETSSAQVKPATTSIASAATFLHCSPITTASLASCSTFSFPSGSVTVSSWPDTVVQRLQEEQRSVREVQSPPPRHGPRSLGPHRLSSRACTAQVRRRRQGRSSDCRIRRRRRSAYPCKSNRPGRGSGSSPYE